MTHLWCIVLLSVSDEPEISIVSASVYLGAWTCHNSIFLLKVPNGTLVKTSVSRAWNILFKTQNLWIWIPVWVLSFSTLYMKKKILVSSDESKDHTTAEWLFCYNHKHNSSFKYRNHCIHRCHQFSDLDFLYINFFKVVPNLTYSQPLAKHSFSRIRAYPTIISIPIHLLFK